MAIIGPSGCGKTTLLKHVNKLIEPTRGRLSVFGKPLTDWDAVELRRKIGYVIQSGGLFPHYTVRQNIELVPQLVGQSGSYRKEKTQLLLNMLDLPEEYLNRYPAELSGGEQQRVGIARALAADQELILLDEPFSALDTITRRELQQAFQQLKKELNTTIMMVTHDLEEALFLADVVLIMNEGCIEQLDAPDTIRQQPASEFVVNFLKEQLAH